MELNLALVDSAFMHAVSYSSFYTTVYLWPFHLYHHFIVSRISQRGSWGNVHQSFIYILVVISKYKHQ